MSGEDDCEKSDATHSIGCWNCKQMKDTDHVPEVCSSCESEDITVVSISDYEDTAGDSEAGLKDRQEERYKTPNESSAASETLEPAAWRCKICDYATNNMHKLRSHAKINHKQEYKDAQHADGWYVDAIYEKTVRLSDVRELLDAMQRKVNQDLEEDDEIGHDFRMAGIAAMDILNSYVKQRLPKFTQKGESGE